MVKDKVIKVIKRNGTTEDYNFEKIVGAIKKSADRINYKLTQKELKKMKSLVNIEIDGESEITVECLHGVVEKALNFISKDVAVSYMNYRNYKKEFELNMLNDIESQVNRVLNEVDRDNSNSNTRLISSKRTEIAKKFSKELYQKIHLSKDTIEAVKDYCIYINDYADLLLQQVNCQLFDLKTVLNGGFEIENIVYTEPKNIKVAVSQMGDIILTASANSFGGFTVPNVDKTLAPYYKMSIELYEKEYRELGLNEDIVKSKSLEKAYDDLTQSLQGVEIKLNTVSSARGNFCFSTFTFGDVENDYEYAICKAILEVRMKGHGKETNRKQLIFPKLVFIHNESIHGENCKYSSIFDLAIKCSSKNLYPDYIGKGHTREGKVVSPINY